MTTKMALMLCCLSLNTAFAYEAETGDVAYEEAVQNPGGAVTFIMPRMFINKKWRTFSGKADAKGVCLRLGLDDGEFQSLEELKFYSTRPVIVDREAQFVKVYDYDIWDLKHRTLISSIKCW